MLIIDVCVVGQRPVYFAFVFGASVLRNDESRLERVRIKRVDVLLVNRDEMVNALARAYSHTSPSDWPSRPHSRT